jgi:hypothetical protein
MDFTKDELKLLIEALERTATRQESEAQYDPKNARPHEVKAYAMRRLVVRLLPKVAAATALVLFLIASVPVSAWAGQYCETMCSRNSIGSGQTCRTLCR